MFFTIFISVLSVVIVVLSLVAIVMSTSHGTAWVQSLWSSWEDGRKPPADGARTEERQP